MKNLNGLPTVERWDLFELSLNGSTEGNPFTERTITGHFIGGAEDVTVSGFYDGEGIYKVRFMPSFTGEYRFTVTGSFSEEEYTGSFTVTPATGDNHGPVHVAGGYHFAYEDGKPYYSVGTTCYVWALQSDERIAQTLHSMEEAGFNKLRFCILPKHYDYNLGEPRSYPYVGTPMDCSVLTKENFLQYFGSNEGNDFDLTRFNPEHFRHLEKCILALQKLGVEADIIVMHPYDRWGFSEMTKEQDELYWRYVLARFSAFRNVWWSLANEYDLLGKKTIADWERYAELICECDPYRHPRSIHNCCAFYDHNRPWVTHCSCQRQDIYKTAEYTNEWRAQYRKPVVLDEVAYEGNIQHGWGNITGEEMVRRFWEGFCRGGYPGHGETYLNEDGVLWWSHGGTLHGESWKRVKFLRSIMEETPGLGLKMHGAPNEWDEVVAVPEDSGMEWRTGYQIHYYSFMRPSFRIFHLEENVDYRVEVIDTWNMTIEDRGIHRGSFRIDLPGRQYMAIRLRKA